MKKYYVPTKHGISRCSLIKVFSIEGIEFAIHTGDDGLIGCSHYISGRSVTVERTVESVEKKAIKMIERAIENNFDFDAYHKLNTPKNQKIINEFESIINDMTDEHGNQFDDGIRFNFIQEY